MRKLIIDGGHARELTDSECSMIESALREKSQNDGAAAAAVRKDYADRGVEVPVGVERVARTLEQQCSDAIHLSMMFEV